MLVLEDSAVDASRLAARSGRTVVVVDAEEGTGVSNGAPYLLSAK